MVVSITLIKTTQLRTRFDGNTGAPKTSGYLITLSQPLTGAYYSTVIADVCNNLIVNGTVVA